MRRLALIPFLLTAASLCTFGSVDPELLALVPPGSKLISGVDLDHARSSQLGQYMLGKMHTDDQGLADLIQQTGFDPRRDLQQILFVGAGPQGPGQEPSFAILARGNFDQSRIGASARKKGLAPQTFQGVELFVDKSQPKEPHAFAFLGGGIGVMGDLDTVKLMISSRGGRALDPAVQAEVSKTGADNDVWFVSSVFGSTVASHLNGVQLDGAQSNPGAKQALSQAQMLESVQEASGGIQLGDSVRLSFDAVTRSAKDATSLADVVRFFTSMVQMQRQKDPRADVAATAFDNMSLTTDGNALHLSISVPEKSLEQLVDGAPWHNAPHAHAQ